MGMNYYVEYDLCKHCGRVDRYHIGKSSYGWAFTLHIEPELGINELEDIIPLMEKGSIFNEDNERISKQEMLDKIINNNGTARHFIADFCIGHGKEGNYDLVTGDFR